MKSFFARLLLFLLTTSAQAQDAFIQLDMEQSQIYLGGSTLLVVSSTGLDDELSLESLDNLPATRRETIGTYLRVYEGKLVQFDTRRIDIQPAKAGTYTIGPLTAGNVQSNTLTLQVLAGAPEAWQLPAQQVELSVNVTPAQAYSQQMMIYEATLRHRYPLLNETFELPDFTGFRVIPEEEARRIWDDDGDGWRHIHWRYLLFPLQSGPITIQATKVSGEIIKSSWQRAGFTRESDVIQLDIHPPAEGEHWWLPAQRLSVSDVWTPSPPDLQLGQTVRRRITIEADGVGARQIPNIELSNSRGLKIVALDQSRSEKLSNGQLKATASFDFSIRPTSATPTFLDTVKVHWWNTQKQQLETAVLPARRLDVAMPERADLLQAYRNEISWTDRLSALLSGSTSSYSYIASTLLLLLSLLYLISTAVSGSHISSRHAQRKARKSLIRAMRAKDADMACRRLNEWKRQGTLSAAAEPLRLALGTALARQNTIDASQWQRWLQQAKRLDLLEPRCLGKSQLPDI